MDNDTNILGNTGSQIFKQVISSSKSKIPRETNINDLNKFYQIMTQKKYEINNQLNTLPLTQGQKQTTKTYLDDIDDVINLIDERKAELEAEQDSEGQYSDSEGQYSDSEGQYSEGEDSEGGTRRRRRKNKKKKSYKKRKSYKRRKTTKKRKSSRKRHI